MKAARYGANDRVRTDDLLITSELLYRLSYVGIAWEPGLIPYLLRDFNPKMR